MALRNPYRNVRVGGGGYTYFKWQFPGDGPQLLGWSQEVQITSPSPVADAQAIQPLNEVRPIEIITTAAIGHWQIVINNFELWNKQVWATLVGLTGATDLADIFKIMADQGNPIQVHQIITPPVPGGATYFRSFNGCVVTDARDDETINVSTMQIIKAITVWATEMSIHRGAGEPT